MDTLSERQNEVLDAALELLVERGEAPTMMAVASRANCSKETLYKWFGGRDGLLTETVRRQASKVATSDAPMNGLTADGLHAALSAFASVWLETISGETSVALNRLAVGEAGIDGRALGRIVLDNGPLAMRERLRPLMETARGARLIHFDDLDVAFTRFFGLVIGDLQIRLLLGDNRPPDPSARRARAEAAARDFLVLHGPDATRGNAPSKQG